MSHTRFPRTSRLRRGYHCRQVDSFLERVESALDGVRAVPSAAEVRRAGFELVRRGYQVAAVDDHLDDLEGHVGVVMREAHDRGAGSDPEEEEQDLRERLDTPYLHRFARTAALRRGYDPDTVDDFVDRVIGSLDGSDGLQLDDVRRAAFPSRRGGYDENAVDEALDRVVELLLMRRYAVDGRTRPSGPDVEAAGPVS